MTEQKPRYQFVDIAKGIGIICVLYGHLTQNPVGRWMNSFHVPLFFFLCGFVFRVNLGPKTFLKKKIKSLLIPYIGLGIPMIVFQIIRNSIEGRFSVHSSLVLCVEYVMQIRFWTLWYIAALLWVSVGFYIIVKYLKKEVYVALAIVVLPTIGLIYYANGGKGVYWNIDISLMASLFFGLGYLCKIHYSYLQKKITGTNGIVLLIISLIVNVGGWFLNEKLAGTTLSMFEAEYTKWYITIPTAICGICFVVLLSHFIQSKCLSYIGQNSMLYFAWHQQIMIPLFRVLFHLIGIEEAYELKAILILITLTGILHIIKKTRLRFILGK